MRFIFRLAADDATSGFVDVGDDEREKTNKPLSGKILRAMAKNKKENMILVMVVEELKPLHYLRLFIIWSFIIRHIIISKSKRAKEQHRGFQRGPPP